MGVQRNLGMDLSKLLLFRGFGTAWAHPPQEKVASWPSSPSALTAPCLLLQHILPVLELCGLIEQQ